MREKDKERVRKVIMDKNTTKRMVFEESDHKLMVEVMHGWMDGSSNLPRDKEVMRFMLTDDERVKK